MMSLFDDEQIMRTYIKDLKREIKQEIKQETKRETRRETLIENAKHMLKMGKVTVEEIPVCYPGLTMDDAKEIEMQIMQLV